MVLQIIVYAFLFLFGVIPAVFMTVSIPVVIIWKIYRSVRYGIRITD